MRAKLFAEHGPLSSFLQSVGSLAPDLIFGIGQGDDLYHYTDLAGLKGIVEKHDLWLTHTRFLNDSEEMVHGQGVVKEVLAAMRAKPRPPLKPAYLEAVEQLLADPVQVDVCICSFCRNDDLLSQWRGYGANGAGVCIRFAGHGFDFITGADSPQNCLVRLWRVFYDREQQMKIVRDALTFFPRKGSSPAESARHAVNAIQFFLPTFKNACFKEENECRLIFTPSPPFDVARSYRVARGMLIPYYSLQSLRGAANGQHALPIKGVTVGPSANKELNRESIEWLLAQSGYADAEVTASAMPFRG